MLRTLLKKNK